MSILEELQIVLGGLPAPIETGVFSEKAPDGIMYSSAAEPTSITCRPA